MVEIIAHVMASGRVENFEFGLGLILDGLEGVLNRAEGSSTSRGKTTTL